MKSLKYISGVVIGILFCAGGFGHLLAQDLPEHITKELEKTNAGRCAIAYIQAFNAEGDEALRKLYKKYKSPDSLEEKSLEDRVSSLNQARQMMGVLFVAEVSNNSDTEVAVKARSEKLNMWFSIQIIMDKDLPEFNDSLRIGPTSPPSKDNKETEGTEGKRQTESQKAKPQTPKKPYPYEEQTVTYKSQDGSINLAGTLTLPKSEGPHPAVYLIPGGSPFDRDQTLGPHKSFLVWADLLTREGFAVLRMDDRGMGESTGSKTSSGYEDLIGDVLEGIGYLRKHKKIDAERIGVMGHSQGGVLAPFVAARSSDVSFVVMLAGTGMTFMENLAYQQAEQGFGTLALNLDMTRRAVQLIKDVSSSEVTPENIQDFWKTYVQNLSAKKRAEAESFMNEVNAPLAMFLSSPMFRDLLVYDTGEVLKNVSCPVLALAGEMDPLDINLPAIAQALEEGGNSNYSIQKLPNINHFFQFSETEDLGGPSSWIEIEETVNLKVLNLVIQWLKSQIKKMN